MICNQHSKCIEVRGNMSKEKIIELINEIDSKISNAFDDWLCYEKYGEEKFLSKGFRPAEEDYAMEEVFKAEVVSETIKSILKFEDAETILKDLSEHSKNQTIKKWSEEILDVIHRN